MPRKAQSQPASSAAFSRPRSKVLSLFWLLQKQGKWVVALFKGSLMVLSVKRVTGMTLPTSSLQS